MLSPRPLRVLCICLSLSLFLFSPFVHLCFPLFPHPSVSLPRYSSSNTWTPLYCNLFQSLPFFLPKLSDGPLTPQIPASSPPSLLPLCPPWSGAKGLHPLPEGPLYRRGWGWGQSRESEKGSEQKSDRQSDRCLQEPKAARLGPVPPQSDFNQKRTQTPGSRTERQDSERLMAMPREAIGTTSQQEGRGGPRISPYQATPETGCGGGA